MDRACNIHGGRGMHIDFWWESQKEKDHQEDRRRWEDNIKKGS
jgi:hypothetical protein